MRFSKHDKWSIGAAALAVAALGLTAAVTLGGFSATIANNSSSFAAATVQLKEGQGATTCYSTGSGTGGPVNATNENTSCAINALGAAVNQVPGGPATSTTVKLMNVGSVNASGGTLVAGTCNGAAAPTDGGYQGTDSGGFCAKVNVTMQLSSTLTKCLYPKNTAAACGTPTSSGTLAALSGGTLKLPAISAGGSVTVTIKAKLDTTATNADQGLKATVPLTWSIHQ